MSKLPLAFYRQADVVQVARQLVGKVLYTQVDGALTAGRIVETEAYNGTTDRACHAYPRKRTPRTDIFFQPGGLAYVYLCYGIHHLFNIVTNTADEPDAVLIRGLEPLAGTDLMLARRNMQKVERRLTAGPGTLSQAMGISTAWNGLALDGDTIWLEDDGFQVSDLIASPRVGVDYAGEDAKLPWRFRLPGSTWVSPAK